MVASPAGKQRTPLGVTQLLSSSSSSSSRQAVQVMKRKAVTEGARADRKRKTVSTMPPPPGHQFLTVFDCKYYGSSTLGAEDSKSIAPRECARLVRQTVSSNNRHHTAALLKMSDKGVTIQGDGKHMVLEVDQLRKIVPGTIPTKSGKTLRVALIIERFPDATNQTPFHVIQFKQQGDLKQLAEAVKRMWRDHMFTALLDVTSEEGQNAFDSFSIEQDIAAINNRCSTLIAKECFEFEKALDGLFEEQESNAA